MAPQAISIPARQKGQSACCFFGLVARSYRTSSITASWPAITHLSGKRAEERRHVGQRAAGRVGLIFTHNLKALLAAIVPAQTDRHAEGCLAFVIRGFDHFRARAAGAPISDFSQGRGGGIPVAAFQGCAMRRFKAAEGRFNGCKSRLGHEIALRRYRPVRTSDCVILSFLDERAAHCRFPVLPELRVDFSASIRFEASAFVRRISKLFAASHSSETVLRKEACAPFTGSPAETQSSGSLSVLELGAGLISSPSLDCAVTTLPS